MKIALVTNSLAGNGEGLRMSKRIHQILNGKGIAGQIFMESEWNSQINSCDQVWVVGGDGTLNKFINAFHDIDKPIALFAGGTGNDFHAILYQDMIMEDQVEYVLKAVPRNIDAGRCNDQYFLNGIGIGFEGAVVKRMAGAAKLPGKTSFLLAILRGILFYRSRKYSVSCAERTLESHFLMIDVANGKRYGGGFHVAPLARPDDGFLDVNLVGSLSPWKRIFYLPVIEKGKHLSLSFVNYFCTQKIVIRCSNVMQAHIDGEYIESKEFSIEILPSRFKFIYSL